MVSSGVLFNQLSRALPSDVQGLVCASGTGDDEDSGMLGGLFKGAGEFVSIKIELGLGRRNPPFLRFSVSSFVFIF